MNGIQGDRNFIVQGDRNQIVLGHGNQVSQSQNAASQESFTQKDAIVLLNQIQSLIDTAQLSNDIKTEATTYLNAAQQATAKAEPKTQTALVNLESMAETLENASKTVAAGKTLWEQVKPPLVKVATWLGAAAGSLLTNL